MGTEERSKAYELLTHYFKSVYEKAGLEWTVDNDNEIIDLVDALMFVEN